MSAIKCVSRDASMRKPGTRDKVGTVSPRHQVASAITPPLKVCSMYSSQANDPPGFVHVTWPDLARPRALRPARSRALSIVSRCSLTVIRSCRAIVRSVLYHQQVQHSRRRGSAYPPKGGMEGGFATAGVEKWDLELEQLHLARSCDRLGAAGDLELAKNAVGVGLDRAQGNDQYLRDLRVGHAARDQAQDFQLARAQWLHQRLRDEGQRMMSCRISFRLHPFAFMGWEGSQEPGDVVRRNPACVGGVEHRRHDWAFIDKAADEALWCSERERALKRHQCVAVRPLRPLP